MRETDMKKIEQVTKELGNWQVVEEHQIYATIADPADPDRRIAFHAEGGGTHWSIGASYPRKFNDYTPSSYRYASSEYDEVYKKSRAAKSRSAQAIARQIERNILAVTDPHLAEFKARHARTLQYDNAIDNMRSAAIAALGGTVKAESVTYRDPDPRKVEGRIPTASGGTVRVDGTVSEDGITIELRDLTAQQCAAIARALLDG